MLLKPEMNWPDIQKSALAFINENGWPDKGNELWKYTSVHHLAERAFTSPKLAESAAHSPKIGHLDGLVISIEAGQINPAKWPDLPDGLNITDISDDDQARIAAFDTLPEDHFTTALNISHQSCALSISLGDGVVLEKPIIIIVTGGKESDAIYPFISLSVGKKSSLKLAEIHHAQAGLSCPLLLANIADEGRFDHIKLQDDSSVSTHIGLSYFTLHSRAHINSFTLSKGAKLSRLETRSNFAGTDAYLDKSAIYLATGDQHHDITSFVGHEHPSCKSNQAIRGVLDDKARGVFQGKIRVAPDAQKTDGQQMSRALVLSRDAEADTKPELEIFADDVACSHGATVGELDEHLLFYLTSRGINKKQARAMLIKAFLADTLARIEYRPFADYLNDQLIHWASDHLKVKGDS